MQGIVDEILYVNDVITEAIADTNALLTEINAELAVLPGAVRDAVNTMVAALNDAAAKGLADLDGAIRDTLTAAAAEAVTALNTLAADATMALNSHLMEVLGALDTQISVQIAAVVDAFNEAYIGAVTGELAIDCDSTIVSIGDASAVNAAGESYTAKLAKALSEQNGLEATIEYIPLAEAGLMAEDLMDVVLANAAVIADAEMVTVSVDNNDFIFDRISQMILTNNAVEEIDWSKYVTAEGVPYVEEALAELHAYFTETGLGEFMGVDFADIAVAAVESFAYSYADYAWNYAQVLTAIHEINPDAQVVLVGGYNPMDGLVLGDINIGEIVDGIVELSDLYGLIYAMIVPNTTYVAVPDVETIAEDVDGSLSVFGYIFAAMEGTLTASEDGHEYIKDQILAAFTVCAGDHVWDGGVFDAAENCLETDKTTYTCTVCGDTKYEFGGKGPHTPGEWTDLEGSYDEATGDLTQVKNCTVCGTELDRQVINAGGSGDEPGGDPVTPPYSGGYYVPVQKPTIEASEGVKVDLSADGTKATITVEDGYILMDVTLNGESLGDDVYEVTGLKTGDVLKVAAMSEADFAAYVKDTQLVARSKMSRAKGKDAVKVYWYEKSGDEKIYDLEYDGYQVYRSVKRFSGFGKKPIFTTERTAYWNTAIEEGVKYYYKVRGYVELNGKKYYTDWSLKAWRTVEF